MLSDKIKITEDGEAYGKKEIALAIRNSTYNDELKCSLMEPNIIKDCDSSTLKLIKVKINALK